MALLTRRYLAAASRAAVNISAICLISATEIVNGGELAAPAPEQPGDHAPLADVGHQAGGQARVGRAGRLGDLDRGEQPGPARTSDTGPRGRPAA